MPPVNIVDQLNQIWNQILDFTAPFVIPDWGALIGLLPLFLLALLLGPLLTLMALVWLIYCVRKPRAKLAIVEGPRPAPLDEDGQPMYPTGSRTAPATGSSTRAGRPSARLPRRARR